MRSNLSQIRYLFQIYSALNADFFPVYVLRGTGCGGHDRAFICNWIFVKSAGNQDMHKLSNKVEFLPDPIINYNPLRDETM